jgi:hypothetical protein
VLIGCSDPSTVGVVNTCPFPVEARGDAADGWTVVEATARSRDGFGGDPVELQLRRLGGERSLSLSLSADSLREVDDGPYGAEIVITLELCELLSG